MLWRCALSLRWRPTVQFGKVYCPRLSAKLYGDRRKPPKEAMTASILKDAVKWILSASCSWQATLKLAVGSIALIAFTGGHRIDEVLPQTLSSLSPPNQLSRGFTIGDLEGVEEASGSRQPWEMAVAKGHQGHFLVFIPSSKTDQHCRGLTKVIARTGDSLLCPASWLVNFWKLRSRIAEAQWAKTSPIFCDSDRKTLTNSRFNILFKQALCAVKTVSKASLVTH